MKIRMKESCGSRITERGSWTTWFVVRGYMFVSTWIHVRIVDTGSWFVDTWLFMTSKIRHLIYSYVFKVFVGVIISMMGCNYNNDYDRISVLFP